MHTTTAQKPQSQSSAKRALLEKLRQGKLRKKSAEPQGIPRYTDDGPLQLSFAQQRLWFLEQFEGGHPTYNEPFHARLKGPLDIDALERTLNEIVRRHDTLRSSFKNIDGQPFVEIAPELTLTLTVQDLRKVPLEQREETARQRQQENACRIFDLSECPLFRVELLRIADEEFLLLFTFHHIIYDGWSINVLMHELKTLYEAFSKGGRTPLPKLPELPVQYADFARWQREYMQGDKEERQLSYWREKLKGPLPTLDLPTDYPRPPQQTFKGKQYRFQLSKLLSEKLEALSKQQKCTLPMLTLAAFKVLLYRYTGQEDILVGSPVANRTRRETEPLIGMFVNTLVLRSDLSGNPTFLELLKQVRQTVLSSQEHQELPFDVLVEELLPQRDLSHTPLFQAWFIFQNFEVQSFPLSETHLQELGFHTETSKFDLTFQMLNSDDGFHIFVEYNTKLFHKTTILRMFKHFQTLLEGIAAQPIQRIGELPLLTISEQKQILEDWNDTDTEYPKETCIHELFEAQVERTPNNVALGFGELQLTYQELNQRANQVAHYLQRLNVPPGTRVGICIERSLEMIVGLLGILKAGATYVPLDPEYPEERLAFMIEDCQAPVLLTQQKLSSEFSKKDVRIVCLDSDWETISEECGDNPQRLTSPDNLIYIIYTSGSTGKPKGAGVFHRNFTNLVNWFVTEFNITEDDSALLISSFNFDLTQKNIYAPLIRGGRLHIPQMTYYEPSQIIRTIQQQKVSWVNCTPSAFHALVECSEFHDFEELEPLRYVFLGGEPISIPNIVNWLRSDRCRAKIVNTYGPTECTDISNSFVLEEPEEYLDTPVPLGKPIFNVKVLVLDRQNRLVPVGVPGELCITGASVGIGYLNNAALTEEKFIKNPYADESAPRLYKTGDLVRYLPDGKVEFLGRIDHQVKIRGFRIEPGEIESTLSNHSAVWKVVVIARDDESGSKRLVAYLVLYEHQQATADELRDFLKADLPDYMIPSAFVCLDEFPLTPNGKIDRKALPTAETSEGKAGEQYVPPRNKLEQTLAEIWAEILGVQRVGIHDDFFELGGHSLLAIQLTTKLSKILGNAISVRTLFFSSTIAKLAKRLHGLLSSLQEADLEDVSLQIINEPYTPTEKPALYYFENRPLLNLFAAGKLRRCDSVVLDYFTTSLQKDTGLHQDEMCYGWCQDIPTMLTLAETSWGRMASLMLPLFDSELFHDKERLLASIVEALEMAKLLGGRIVSLGGLLVPATNYGQDIMEAIDGRDDLPSISTGYALVCAAYMLNLQKILQESGRELSTERVAFVGSGTLGRGVLLLMLQCFPHPEEILLCDTVDKAHALETVRNELTESYGFQGNLRLVKLLADRTPTELFDMTLWLNTLPIPNMFDISDVRPGTLLINPGCFYVDRVFSRFEEQEDILFTSGSVLRVPHPFREQVYVPHHLKGRIHSEHFARFNSKSCEYDIPACGLAGLLAASFEELKPTTGEKIDIGTALQYYRHLQRLNICGAHLQYQTYTLLEKKGFQNFRKRFINLSSTGR